MSKYITKWCMHEEKGVFLDELKHEEVYDTLSPEALKKLNYAFYEICLDVSVDTDTGEITILSAT